MASDSASPAPGANHPYTETASGMNLRMAWIPGGAFQMGSEDGYDDEKPVHAVEVDGFWMATTETTNRQYRAFLKGSGYDGGDSYGYLAHIKAEVKQPTGDDYPIICVRWRDAVAFCDRLSTETQRRYSLPTEAQWEYACRAGSQGRWSFGDDASAEEKYAWRFHAEERIPRKVAGRLPNAWGLFDMHGNVWEWCRDRYGEDYYQASPPRNPPGPAQGEFRVMRGGSWFETIEDARSAHRLGADPEKPVWHAGFRVCRLP